MERTEAMARATWWVLRAQRRLILIPLVLLGAMGALGTATLAAASHTLEPRVRVFGSAYRTGDFGVAGAHPPTSSAVTTIVPTWWTPVVLLAGYLLGALALTATTSVVTAATYRTVTGRSPSLAGAVHATVRHGHLLVAWSLAGLTVGAAHRLAERSALLAALTRRPAGWSWRRTAWLAVAVTVIEGHGPRRSLRRSRQLQDDTWGPGALHRTGVGGASAALLALAVPAAAVLAPRGPAGAIAAVSVLAGCIAVIVTVSAVVRGALYAHAAGEPVHGFDPAFLAGALAPRAARTAPAPATAGLYRPALVGRRGEPRRVEVRAMTATGSGGAHGETTPAMAASLAEAIEEGRTVEGVLAIRHLLDEIEPAGSSLLVEDGFRFPAHLTDDLLAGEAAGGDELADDDDLVDELIERVAAGHGLVMQVPSGALDELGGIVLVVPDRPAGGSPAGEPAASRRAPG